MNQPETTANADTLTRVEKDDAAGHTEGHGGRRVQGVWFRRVWRGFCSWKNNRDTIRLSLWCVCAQQQSRVWGHASMH